MALTIPPMAQRLKDWLRGAHEASIEAMPLPKEVADVLSWLRGDEARCATLVNLLNYRVDGRGLLPIPSNPHEVMVNVGRDREARELARLLLSLCSSPVPSGSTDEEHERGSTDRGLPSRRV